jgi:tetratricopeptide (TPR) repeat protein
LHTILSRILQIVWLIAAVQPDYRQAVTLLEARDLKGAANAARRALAADPAYVPAIALMARIEMASGNLDSAEKRLRSAVAAHKADTGLQFLLGFCLYLGNDFDGALDALARADAADPNVILYRALSNEGLGREQNAVALYRQAIAMTKSSEPRLALARLLRKEGDLNEASRLIDDALGNEPRRRDILYEKGQSLLAAGDAIRAAEFGERALAVRGDVPSEREIRYLLVRAYTKSGDASRAALHRNAFEKLPLSLVR